MNVLDSETAQLLRRAVQLAGDGLVTVAHLRRAVEDPAETELAPTRLRGAEDLNMLVMRAMTLAEQRPAQTITRDDLLTALVEAEALAAGLDLSRLRFARWRIGRAYGDGAGGRRYASDVALPLNAAACVEEAS